MAIAEVSRTTTAAPQARSAGRKSAEVASVALVPVAAGPRRLAAAQGLTRPDPCFVTHLIAMAEFSPQTRALRRAAPEEAQAAYLSVADQDRSVTPVGARMRRIA